MALLTFTLNDNLGKEFRAVRRLRKLKIRKLAELSGVHENTIIRMEKGHEPSLSTVFAVAEVLKITIQASTGYEE